jgi:hypothetical protein
MPNRATPEPRDDFVSAVLVLFPHLDPASLEGRRRKHATSFEVYRNEF